VAEVAVVAVGPGRVVDVSALFAEHHLALVRLAVVLVDDRAAAEDVVQDVFADFVRHAGRLRDPDAALGYLRRSTVNAARSVLRRRRTERQHPHAGDTGTIEGADASTMRAAERDRVMRAVRNLAPRDQQVLALRYWAELSDTEIVHALNIAPGTVRSTISRALDKLERILKDGPE